MFLKCTTRSEGRMNVLGVCTMSQDRATHKTFISVKSVVKSFFIHCTCRRIAQNLKEGERMGKINSKQKGARFERQLAGLLREYGYTDARRTAQYCGNTGDASDVIGLPGIHIEAKHQEKMSLYDWMDQAKRDSEESKNFPTVFHKKNNADILVTMRFDDWMQLYRTYYEDLIWRSAIGKQEEGANHEENE